jgi:hypothetical protein
MNRRNWPRRLFVLGAMSGITGVVVCFGDVVVRETRVGPMPTDSRQLAVTPDGHHAAVVGLGGSRPAVYIDGNVGSPYSAISPWTSLEPGKPPPAILGWSPDNTVLAYVASKGGQFTLVENQREGPLFDGILGVVFSPVGHRIAYIARKGTQNTAANPMQFFVIVDGKASPAHRSVQEVKFSADGRHFGYIMQDMSGSLPNHAVFDGHMGPGFSGMNDLHLSPNGGHYAYVAYSLRTNRIDKAVMVDGKAGPAFAEVRGISFSEDGKHVGYFGTKPGSGAQSSIWQAVIDGQPGPEFQDIPVNGVVFSPDGRRTAYVGKRVIGTHYRALAMIDGNKSLDYDECSDFLFSADSRHVAYIATNSGKSVVVLDGKESDAHQAIDRLSLRFSPDGSHLGFVAQDDSTWRVVIDQKPGAARRDVIDGKSFEFSPDGQHYRFKHRTYSGDWNIVVDDRVDDPASTPVKMAMTADWRHSAAVVRTSENEASSVKVLLDGKQVGTDYAAVDLLEISPDGRHVSFVISKRGESGKNASHVVVDGRESPEYFRVTKLFFSADSQHSAYVAWEDGSKQFVVIDGFKGPVCEVILGSQYEQPGAIQFRPDGSLDYYAAKDGKLTHLLFDAATIASLPKPAAGGASAAGYAEIYAFGTVAKDGSKPAVLTVGPDGLLYGATSEGGQYRYGEIFRMKPDGSDYTIIHQILGPQNDGSYPSTLMVGRDGAIYGTYTVASANGAVFRCAADGSDYKFFRAASGDTDVGEPKLVAQDADGNFFGISGARTTTRLFRLSPAGEFTKLHQAPSSTYYENYQGIGPVVDGRDGFFYGVYAQNIIKVKKDGTGYAVLRKFSGPPLDGSGGEHAPILGSDGKLYGTATGGQAGSGIVYSIGRDGKDYKVLLNPESERLDVRSLQEGPAGKLYALVAKGVASFNKDGSGYSIIYPTDGGNFVDAPFVNGEAIYGVRYSGGAKGRGVVYRYGLGAASAAASPAIVMKEVPAAPLPAVDHEVGPAAADAGTSHEAAAETAVTSPTPAASETASANSAGGQSNPTAPAAGAVSATPASTANTTGNTNTNPTDTAQTGANQPAVNQVAEQADVALAKAKAKAEQAANKAKSWLDNLKKKKKP